jgi:hypothetical protein
MADKMSAQARVGRPLQRFAKVDIDSIIVPDRECEPKDSPAIRLLHSFPSTGHMFRNLIPILCDQFRLVASNLRVSGARLATELAPRSHASQT